MTRPAALTVFAPAKLNLSLSVGPVGKDGRHPLESLACFADVGDVLRLSPAPHLGLTIAGPFGAALAAEADNLVLRAASLLARHGGQALGAAIHLEKNLPIASGIGGGSADAAAALRGLNRLWGLDLPLPTLQRLGRALGADVPVCLACVPAFMSGGGEDTAPFTMPTLSAVLVNPGVPAATAAVYRRFDALDAGQGWRPAGPPAGWPQPWDTPAAAWRALAALENDLTEAALAEAPAIAPVLHRLKQDPRCQLVRLSGSGATCFALTEGPAASQALAQDLAAEARGWWIAPTQLGSVSV